MKTSTTFSILIWIKKSNSKTNQAKLYARITVNQKRVNISLKKDVDVSAWDKNKSQIIGNSQKARITNNYIEQVKVKLFQSYQNLKLEDKLITAQAIKSNFLGEDEVFKSMEYLITYHNDKMAYKLHKDTMRHYKSSQNYLRKFIKKEFKTNDVYLKDLNYSFIIGFEDFLRSYQPTDHQRRIGNNTVMKHIQRLRKMVTMAFKMEWIIRDPFVKFRSSFIKSEREFLSEEDLQTIEGFSSSIKRLELVRDLFVFSCYTGIAYIDIMQLTTNNISKGIDGNIWIITKRQKTNTPVKIPLLEKASCLIDKYANSIRAKANGTLFPKFSNQKINSYLKELAVLCKIKKNLTFHMARHTFATTVTLTNGVPIETVSKLLGHTKLATTQIYARVIERKVSDDMNALKVLLANKSNQKNDKQNQKSSD